jgi:predicted nucleotidyltransferase
LTIRQGASRLAAVSSVIEDAVAAVAAAEPTVIAAWIFGSRGRGEARRHSDLDVAVLTTGTSAECVDRIAGELAGRTNLDVDVCRLEIAGPVLAYEVVTDGRRVFARDEDLADRHEERIRREYLDTAHLRRVQHHYLYGDPL